MIGKLKGTIDTISDDLLIIDVNGVGYEVCCPLSLLGRLKEGEPDTELMIETYVREDQIKLFGFSSGYEREWFRLLMRVQGVGARLAITILGTITAPELATAIVSDDKQTLTRVAGVGPKVAGRIIAELQTKAPSLSLAGSNNDIATSLKATPTTACDNAISALVNLGVPLNQATAAVKKAIDAYDNPDDSEQDNTAIIIRKALAELSSIT